MIGNPVVLGNTMKTGWAIFVGRMAASLFVICGLVTSGAVAQDRESEEQARIADLIEKLHDYQFGVDNLEWTSAIYELREIGAPAVPPLIEALDATDDDRTLRALGFTLRVIGDARAVPSLIRAIPRTLRTPGSDMGVRVSNPELFQFMLENDVSQGDKDDSFTMGRPVREICEALKKITHSDQDDRELYHVTKQGGQLQQWAQRRLYYEHSLRWEKWWKEHWRDFLMNPEFSDANLEPFHEMRPIGDVDLDDPFPTGEDVKVGGGLFNLTVSLIFRDAYGSFVDLDTLRLSGYPKDFFPKDLTDEAVYEQIAADRPAFTQWCRERGFDLYGSMVQLEGNDEVSFTLFPIGMRFWPIENDRFKTLGAEVARTGAIERGEPLPDDALLMARDSDTGEYLPNQPASFLFVTSEGTTGAIQVLGPVNREFPNGSIRRGVLVNFQYLYRDIAE